MPDLLISSRTVFGGAGWASRVLLASVNHTAQQNQWRAKAILGATCSSIIAGADTRGGAESDSQWGDQEWGGVDLGDESADYSEPTEPTPRNRDEWHASFLDGLEKSGVTFTQAIPENLRGTFHRLFGGVTPIPGDFAIISNKGSDFEVRHTGSDAVTKLYSQALALEVSKDFFQGRQTLEEATSSFFQAREIFFRRAADDDMAYWDEEEHKAGRLWGGPEKPATANGC